MLNQHNTTLQQNHRQSFKVQVLEVIHRSLIFASSTSQPAATTL